MIAAMNTATAAPDQPTMSIQTCEQHSDSGDSDDDSDVAFAYMDFDGVDFDDGGAPASAPAPTQSSAAACRDAAEAEVSCIKAAENDVTPLDHGDGEDGHDKFATSHDLNGQIRYNKIDTELNCNDDASSSAKSKPSGPPSSTASPNRRACQERALSSIKFIPDDTIQLTDIDKTVLAIEKDWLLPRPAGDSARVADSIEFDKENIALENLRSLLDLLENGKYADILRSDLSQKILGSTEGTSCNDNETMMDRIKRKVLQQFTNEMSLSVAIIKCIELEIIGIASLNLFLQLNYTGPSMDRGLRPEEEKHDDPLDGINPHAMFQSLLQKGTKSTTQNFAVLPSSLPLDSISEDDVSTNARPIKDTISNTVFHNAVLSELAVDGEWPFQVCIAPYFLMLGRTILSMLAEPTRPFRRWSDDEHSADDVGLGDLAKTYQISLTDGAVFASAANYLSSDILWNARAIVAHRRLISTRRDDDDGQACPSLWNEAKEMFSRCLAVFCEGNEIFDDKIRNAHISSEVMLEYGLAEHHFRKPGRGKTSFNRALEIAKLEIQVTGAEGKRTKYQQTATAQYLVRAKPSSLNTALDQKAQCPPSTAQADIEKQLMIKHDDVSDDAILLEKIKFEEEDDNEHHTLTIQEQSILLALCLDVKNDNPMDGLTGEQMGGYLARVLNQHDDWMVYATALLERAWLECERTHGRERAILQIQALADQHSNRLTLTQSTFKSVEEDSAPAEERLRNLHGIVYPPRWDMLRDLAERYTKLGVVTSAAEIFEEIELWDEVVECYRIAGKESKAEEVVRARLAERETPRMYAALGGLTHDPMYFERSLELSNGKFYDAHVALGKFYFDNGDLRKSLKHFQDGLEIKPLMPAVWFRVGTISMQLGEWDTALRAFTQVVQQEPEEGEAWANVAAIHMRRRNPSEAYPALIEVSY